MIPNYWANETENYITNPIINDFLKLNNPEYKYSSHRKELVDTLNEFYNSNDENKKVTEAWFQFAMRQGMKHIWFKKIDISNELMSILTNSNNCIILLQDLFKECKNTNLCNNITGKEITLQSIDYEKNDNNINKIIFVYTIWLYEEKNDVKSKIPYPIFVDLDLDNNIIFGRAKSKSKIFKVDKNNDNELGTTTSTSVLIKECINDVVNKIQLGITNKDKYMEQIRNALYKLLIKYTFTPQEIKNKLDLLEDFVSDFVSQTIIQLRN